MNRRAGSVPEPCCDATSNEFAPDMPLPFGEDAAVRSAVIGAYEFPARSAGTRRNVRSPCRRPLGRGVKNVVVRNRCPIKYCDLHVQHGNNLPVSPRLLAASCPLACGPIPTYLPARAAFVALAEGESWTDFSCSTTTRQDLPHREKFRHKSPLPISLWVTTQQSLGKLRQRAHRRRFARPPRF